jgi:hypothetical protein
MKLPITETGCLLLPNLSADLWLLNEMNYNFRSVSQGITTIFYLPPTAPTRSENTVLMHVTPQVIVDSSNYITNLRLSKQKVQLSGTIIISSSKHYRAEFDLRFRW